VHKSTPTLLRKSILFSAILFIEFFNSTTGFKQKLLAACVEWMTFGTYLNSNFVFCRAGYELISAVTFYLDLFVFRMNSFSHFFHLFLLINNLKLFKDNRSSIAHLFFICNICIANISYFITFFHFSLKFFPK
jgi:hypothetical protein